MKKQHQQNSKHQLSPYNTCVTRTYFKLLRATIDLLATIDSDELRRALVCGDNQPITFGVKVHQLVSPIVYLSLQCDDSETLTIHFGFEKLGGEDQISYISSRFLRLLYKLTDANRTSINIEKSVVTDYVETDCMSLYEAVEESQLYSYRAIPYKPAVVNA